MANRNKMSRYTRHPIRDETVLVNSRGSHFKESRVIPASFWTAPHTCPFDDLRTISRKQSHERFGHCHIHGTLDGVPAIVQEWLGSKCEVLPFPNDGWLFHKNTPSNALVVLRGDMSVSIKTLRDYVHTTPEFSAWGCDKLSQPFTPFPTPQAVLKSK